MLKLMFPALRLARSTSVRSVLRTAERVEPAFEPMGQGIRGAPEVAPDEMGWRVGGRSAGLHAFASHNTIYQADPGRDHVKHATSWFWFLIDPTIQSTNHWAERAIRPAVVNRKVWGGNRTRHGARVQASLMSVIQAAKQRGFEASVWIQKSPPCNRSSTPVAVINYALGTLVFASPPDPAFLPKNELRQSLGEGITSRAQLVLGEREHQNGDFLSAQAGPRFEAG